MRTLPTSKELADLLYTAEMLHADLLEAKELLAASSVFEAVADLRVKVREENEQ